METLKKTLLFDRKPDSNRKAARKDLSLRGFFLLTIFAVFGAVVLLSGLTIGACTAFRHYLLPDVNSAYLTVEQVMDDGTVTSFTHLLQFGQETKLPQLLIEQEDSDSVRIVQHKTPLDATYSIQKIETSYSTLTPKRKLAYQLCGVAMVAVPSVLSIGGILFCGFFFYRRRLSLPLCLLSEATEQIAAQNLDFSLEYDCGDEMGALCRSFETMRKELAENNKAMWGLLEQRRLMQASIAHDLRNPIAIIEGYTEYLQINLPSGKITMEKANRIAGNLNLAAKRLEQYTESVRTLNQLEDMPVNRKEVLAGELLRDICDDLRMMSQKAGRTLLLWYIPSKAGTGTAGTDAHPQEQEAIPVTASVLAALEDTLNIDTSILYRIIENIFENATRFARSTITVTFRLQNAVLQIRIADDGSGFPGEILRKEKKSILPTGQNGHLGMGLAISRILSEKHGGSLLLRNNIPHGGVVQIELPGGTK